MQFASKKQVFFTLFFFSFINVKLIFKKTSSSSQQQLNVEFYWTSLKSFETAAIYCFLFLSTFFRTTWRHTGDIPRHLNSKKFQKTFDISFWNKLIVHWSCQYGLFPAFQLKCNVIYFFPDPILCIIDILFRQITTFIKVPVTFVLGASDPLIDRF